MTKIFHSRLCIFTGAEQFIKSKIILDLSCVLLPHQLYALHKMIHSVPVFFNHSLHKQNNTIELKVTEFRPSIIFVPILFSLPSKFIPQPLRLSCTNGPSTTRRKSVILKIAS